MHSFIRAGLFLFPLLPSLTSGLPAASIGANSKHGKPATTRNCTLPPYYTLEEHWLSPSLAQQFLANPLNALIGGGGSPGGGTLPKLREIGAQRLASSRRPRVRDRQRRARGRHRRVPGHMGELVPYYLWRSDLFLSPGLSRTLDQVYAGNAYVTTSGIFSLDPVAALVRNTNRTRILYSVDYPFAGNEDGAAFMAALRNSGLVSQAEFVQVAYQNAAELLKIT
ncbi:uncharacterized protein PG986_014113 [Apiospora aurea]|uniref:Amidohydrolase-related domain-containing protein n=1 Tax=Apiospora aurea TaxID=335848 RepID=A0ABR1PS24_9PEZI